MTISLCLNSGKKGFNRTNDCRGLFAKLQYLLDYNYNKSPRRNRNYKTSTIIMREPVVIISTPFPCHYGHEKMDSVRKRWKFLMPAIKVATSQTGSRRSTFQLKRRPSSSLRSRSMSVCLLNLLISHFLILWEIVPSIFLFPAQGRINNSKRESHRCHQCNAGLISRHQ